MKRFIAALIVTLVLSAARAEAVVWPTDAQWHPVLRNGAYLQDSNSDTNGSRNIVSDATHPAAFLYNDSVNLFFRLRLDQDPTGSGGQGALQSFGWGAGIDTNMNLNNYEWLIMVNGISSEYLALSQNTMQGTLGDPSDVPEITVATYTPVGSYIRVVPADSSLNGDQDHFLDWYIPYGAFKTYTGISDASPIRLFWGASSSSRSLTQNGGDLVGGSDLYSMASDFITPMGTTPATGAVKLVADLAGSGDVTQIYAGDTIYVRVDDLDQNYDPATRQTLTVTLKATSGDTAALTLTETAPNSGVFTGSIPTQQGAPVSGDAILQVMPGATVTVEYIDAVDGSSQMNRIRTDSLRIISLLPAISLSKSVDQESAKPGTELIFTIYYHNEGVGVATNLIITDTIPFFTTYVPGSLRMGNAASTYAAGTALTDAADADAGQVNGASVIFTIDTVGADDGAASAGSDEGKVFFKVRVN